MIYIHYIIYIICAIYIHDLYMYAYADVRVCIIYNSRPAEMPRAAATKKVESPPRQKHNCMPPPKFVTIQPVVRG